jgi:predicted CopG family antitoxin
MEYKTIALRRETYERLQKLGTAGNTMDDLVDKLIEKCGDKI